MHLGRTVKAGRAAVTSLAPLLIRLAQVVDSRSRPGACSGRSGARLPVLDRLDRRGQHQHYSKGLAKAEGLRTHSLTSGTHFSPTPTDLPNPLKFESGLRPSQNASADGAGLPTARFNGGSRRTERSASSHAADKAFQSVPMLSAAALTAFSKCHSPDGRNAGSCWSERVRAPSRRRKETDRC